MEHVPYLYKSSLLHKSRDVRQTFGFSYLTQTQNEKPFPLYFWFFF